MLLSLALILLQNAPVETVAGTGQSGRAGEGGPAKVATLNNPFGVVRGPDGAIWFCEYGGHLIHRMAPDGTLSTVAGSGKKGYEGDGGPALQASFNLPHEIRLDATVDFYRGDL